MIIAAVSNYRPKNKFTHKDDAKLLRLVKKSKPVDWNHISKQMRTKSPRQCKERFLFYLDPSLNNTPFTKDEDNKLIQLQKEHGNKWKYISTFFQKRSEISIRNRYKALIKMIKDGSIIEVDESVNDDSFSTQAKAIEQDDNIKLSFLFSFQNSFSGAIDDIDPFFL